jgi:hypothetical protein
MFPLDLDINPSYDSQLAKFPVSNPILGGQPCANAVFIPTARQKMLKKH